MGEFEEIEFEEIDVGSSRSPRREPRVRSERSVRSHWTWWAWGAGAGLVALVIGSIALAGPDNGDTAPTTTRHRRTTTTTTEPVTTTAAPPETTPWITLAPIGGSDDDPTIVTDPPSRFAIFALPEGTGVRLVARTPDAVLEVDLEAGMVQRYDHPDLGTRPAFFVAGDGWDVIRPLDQTQPGWLVGREQGAEPLARELDGVDGLYPGPFGSLWRVDTARHEMSLVDPDGNRLGVDVPIAGADPLAPDGALGVLMSGIGGTYVADAAGIHRVTSGEVLATGPNTLLVHECDESLRCSRAVVDRRTGERRALAGQTEGEGSGPIGAISPDGAIAASIELGPREGRVLEGTLRLTDLATGTVNTIGTVKLEGGLVWTANSQYLFYVGIDGGVHMWDRSDRGQRFVLALGDDNIVAVTSRAAPA